MVMLRLRFFYVTVVRAYGILTNYALNRPAYQSGIGWGGVARRANDGIANPVFFSGSCSHPYSTSATPWWYVDLERPRLVTSFEITNRADGLGMYYV